MLLTRPHPPRPRPRPRPRPQPRMPRPHTSRPRTLSHNLYKTRSRPNLQSSLKGSQCSISIVIRHKLLNRWCHVQQLIVLLCRIARTSPRAPPGMGKGGGTCPPWKCANGYLQPQSRISPSSQHSLFISRYPHSTTNIILTTYNRSLLLVCLTLTLESTS